MSVVMRFFSCYCISHTRRHNMYGESAVRAGVFLLALWLIAFSAPGVGQPLTGIGIKWEVKSRFRLFKYEDDFEYMVRFHSRNGVLADETVLARETSGIGWASRFVRRLCVNSSGVSQNLCPRYYSAVNSRSDVSFNEPYLVPDHHRIALT